MKRVLIIVDVQWYFRKGFNVDYLEKLQGFLEINKDDYDEILCVLELADKGEGDTLDKMPAGILQYVTKAPTYKSFEYPYELPEEIEFCTIEQFMLGDRSAPVVNLLLTDCSLQGGKMAINISTEALNLGEDSQVDLVGGYLESCVGVMDTLLTTLGIEVNVLDDYCYSSFRTQPGVWDGADVEWVEVENPIGSDLFVPPEKGLDSISW